MLYIFNTRWYDGWSTETLFEYINNVYLSGMIMAIARYGNSKFREIDAYLWKNNARSNFCWKQFETDAAVHSFHSCHSLTQTVVTRNGFRIALASRREQKPSGSARATGERVISKRRGEINVWRTLPYPRNCTVFHSDTVFYEIKHFLHHKVQSAFLYARYFINIAKWARE